MKKRKHSRWDDEPRRRPIDEPAGPKRREALARVKDDLEQEIEERTADEERVAIDPEAFTPDPEIIQNMNAFDVSHADPNYRYCWARYLPPAGGGRSQVDEKLGWTVNVGRGVERLWEVVSGLMPEAMEVKSVRGDRQIGDVILLRAKRELHESYVNQMEYLHAKRQDPSLESLQDYLERRGGKLHTFDGAKGLDARGQAAHKHAVNFSNAHHVADMNAARAIIGKAKIQQKETGIRNPNIPKMERAMAQIVGMKLAEKAVDKMIRQGRIPGMAIGD